MKSVFVVINNNLDSIGVLCENVFENVVGDLYNNKVKDSEIFSVLVLVEDVV